MSEGGDYPSNLLADNELVERIAERESWGVPEWDDWDRWRRMYEEREITDVYVIPGGEDSDAMLSPDAMLSEAKSLSWYPGGPFVRIDHSAERPYFEAVAELARLLPGKKSPE